MGYEIAGGLGVKMARPDREVIVHGRRRQLPDAQLRDRDLGDARPKLIIVVLDNRGFGCINRLQQACGGAPFNNLLDDCVPGWRGARIDFAAHAAEQYETEPSRRQNPPYCSSSIGLRLISAATRLQGIFFWDFLIYLIEGMVFLITGLQARTLIARIGDHSISELAISAAVVSAVVIVTRFVWMYPATYLPRWLFPPLKRRDPSPPWQWPFVLAFTGVRGIVSLAAALAIPFATTNGQPFPDRDLILFLTFSVILVTLVGQGLLLPAVIRALGLAHAGRLERHSDNADEHKARRQGIEAAIERLDQITSERNLSENIVQPLRARHRDRLKHIEHRSDGNDGHRSSPNVMTRSSFC